MTSLLDPPPHVRVFHASPIDGHPTLLLEEWGGPVDLWNVVHVSTDAAFALPPPGDPARQATLDAVDALLAERGSPRGGEWVSTPEGASADLGE